MMFKTSGTKGRKHLLLMLVITLVRLAPCEAISGGMVCLPELVDGVVAARTGNPSTSSGALLLLNTLTARQADGWRLRVGFYDSSHRANPPSTPFRGNPIRGEAVYFVIVNASNLRDFSYSAQVDIPDDALVNYFLWCPGVALVSVAGPGLSSEDALRKASGANAAAINTTTGSVIGDATEAVNAGEGGEVEDFRLSLSPQRIKLGTGGMTGAYAASRPTQHTRTLATQ